MDTAIKTDLALLRAGDKAAFERLYGKYWARVYHFTSLYIRDDYEREEIVQNVFIRLWDIRERLNPEKDPDGLLFIINRNLIFNQAHRSANEKALKEAMQADSSQLDDLEARLESEDLQAYIDTLVEALPARQKQAFELSRKEGLSHKKIAAEMGISEKGVERAIYLARKFIRKNLPLFLIFIGL